MEPKLLSKLIPAIFLLILGAIEVLSGFYIKNKRSKNDYTIEIISLLILPTLIQPAIIVTTIWFMGILFPTLSSGFLLIQSCLD